MHSRSQLAGAAALTDRVDGCGREHEGQEAVRPVLDRWQRLQPEPLLQGHQHLLLEDRHRWRPVRGKVQARVARAGARGDGHDCVSRLCKHWQLALLLLRLQEEQGHL